MAALTRKNKDFMLAMLESYVERELKEIEERMRRIRQYVKEVADILQRSMADKERP